MSRKISAYGRRLKTAKHRARMESLATQIIADLDRLQTQAQIHSLIGENRAALVFSSAALWLNIEEAAQIQRLPDDDEDLIVLRRSGVSITQIADQIGSIDQHRHDLVEGMAAANRLAARLSKWALAEAAIRIQARYQMELAEPTGVAE